MDFESVKVNVCSDSEKEFQESTLRMLDNTTNTHSPTVEGISGFYWFFLSQNILADIWDN